MADGWENVPAGICEGIIWKERDRIAKELEKSYAASHELEKQFALLVKIEEATANLKEEYRSGKKK